MKKIGLVLLVMVAGILIAAVAVQHATVTGTTTASYVKALDAPCADWEDLYFIIQNTGSDSTMYYKAWGYALNGGTLYEEFIAETSIDTTGQDLIKISNTAYANIEIYVKDNSGHTTYSIEYMFK